MKCNRLSKALRMITRLVAIVMATTSHGHTEKTDANGVPLKIYPARYLQPQAAGISNRPPMDKTTQVNGTINPAPLVPGNKANMKWLDAESLMGSPTSEAERNSDESQHTAIISYGFYMGNFEVTQGEYQQVVGGNPSYFTPANGYTAGLNRPVENVTWAQANNYCALLTAQALANRSIPAGWAYRLPTEAEWEYSCRTTGATQPDQVLYSQTDTSGEYDTFGVSPMGPTFGAWIVPTSDATITSIKVRMRLYSTAGGVSFLFYRGQAGTQLLMEQDFNANDPLFAPAQGQFADITVPVTANSHGNYLYSGVGVYLRLGSFEGHEIDYKGLISGGAFYPYMTITDNEVANPLTAFSLGNSIHGGMANFDDYYEYNALVGTINVPSPTVPALNMTTNVGSYQPNTFGLSDMHGNVSEWCQDWYGAYPTTTTVDPQGPTNGTVRVVRGGSWADHGVQLRSAARAGYDPNTVTNTIGFRIVLAPVTPDWKAAVSTQPSEMVYGIPPTKLSNNLVLITHGWQLYPSQPDVSFLSTMSNDIVQYLGNSGVIDWQVYGYNWLPNAWKVYPNAALINAKQEGINLGNSLASQGWKNIHFIAHSAGANLIQTAMEIVKARSPNTIIQCTFLDPYVGTDYAGTTTYGQGADWSDRYSCHHDIDGLEGKYTDVPLYSSYNVDVTALDPDLANSDLISGFAELALCSVLEARHGWPIEFYENSITGNITSGYDGFGFLLSNEAGGWPNAPAQYPVGNVSSVTNLGTAPQSCTLLGALAATVGISIDFTAFPHAAQSTSGTIMTSGGTLTLITGSPAWLSIVPTNSTPVDLLSFTANFTSSGAGGAGLLSVYWDSNVVGTVDERMVGEGAAQYSMRFPVTQSNTAHVLSFRLDPFTNIQSTLVLTNVALGQVGVTQPFSLSVTTTNVNGMPVYQLTGQSGFDYGLQASTNLTDWTQIAILENTNGVVNFFDRDSTNYPMRFYRAVAPY